jgi:flagellar export protein FliJ
MKGLATLIKLHKRTLDELRRSMASLENQKEQLLLLSRTLQEELKKEMELAAKTPEMRGFFGDFAKRMRVRQEKIAAEIKELDKQMDKLRGEIAEAFSELKKYEIAEENARLRAAEAASRKETIELDEIAGQQHRLKKDEP